MGRITPFFLGRSSYDGQLSSKSSTGRAQQTSPAEQWGERKPSINHLRTFGCLVYVHIPSENRAKLDRVSSQEIFVGYHCPCQYRIYNPERRKVEWHTSIKFLEHMPGGRLLKKEHEDEVTSPTYGDSDSEGDIPSNNIPASIDKTRALKQRKRGSQTRWACGGCVPVKSCCAVFSFAPFFL